MVENAVANPSVYVAGFNAFLKKLNASNKNRWVSGHDKRCLDFSSLYKNLTNSSKLLENEFALISDSYSLLKSFSYKTQRFVNKTKLSLIFSSLILVG